MLSLICGRRDERSVDLRLGEVGGLEHSPFLHLCAAPGGFRRCRKKVKTAPVRWFVAVADGPDHHGRVVSGVHPRDGGLGAAAGPGGREGLGGEAGRAPRGRGRFRRAGWWRRASAPTAGCSRRRRSRSCPGPAPRLLAPCRSRPMSSIEPAPATMPATRQSAFGAARPRTRRQAGRAPPAARQPGPPSRGPG